MGTMEQVRMAPISTPAFVLGKTLPYLVISQVSAMLIVATAMVLFDLPMRGNWLSLSFVLALFLVGGVGTGLLVSTMTDTQQMALQTSMLIAFLPTMILSGFIFPISSMPAAIQYVTTIVPARYFLVALRGIVLKGLSLGAVWPSLLAMGIYALAVLGISSARLARRADDAPTNNDCAHSDADVEGVPGAAADAAAARAAHHRADHPADAARLCRDHRHQARADRRRGRRPDAEEPAAHRAIQRVAVLQDRRRADEPARRRRGPGARQGLAGDRDSAGAGCRGRGARAGQRARKSRCWPTAPTPTRPASRLPTRRRWSGSSMPAVAAERGCRLESDRWARARLVQPAAREPQLHGAGRHRAAPAARHGEPVVDGDRARARAGHARAAERHAARTVGADSRKAAAVCRAGIHRRAAGPGGGRVLVCGAAAGQRRGCCSARAWCTCCARSASASSSRRFPRRSSRR